ncbi:hypothetical protein P691DRAFT_806178 [Macrolepiota fuliginosa MF-IS2]|uniref:Uncharacterized protein n=1 Tax=Macrolepiota fuliginosa MF-IS2 TaxID=1400762 RepID=A0A9P6BZ81_9AGAR|nr:hypothetical protein P691DRAFT_806178 [Macrolepiota fuliginosa MF-IS2]
MKFILITLAAVALSIAQAPAPASSGTQGNNLCLNTCQPEQIRCPPAPSEGWTPVHTGKCWTCCRPSPGGASGSSGTGADQTGSRSGSGQAGPQTRGGNQPSPSKKRPSLCLNTCQSAPIKCPPSVGWAPFQDGKGCWTCCRDADLATPVAGAGSGGQDGPPTQGSNKSGGLCLNTCQPEPIRCPPSKGWGLVQNGKCWTCCRS